MWGELCIQPDFFLIFPDFQNPNQGSQGAIKMLKGHMGDLQSQLIHTYLVYIELYALLSRRNAIGITSEKTCMR